MNRFKRLAVTVGATVALLGGAVAPLASASASTAPIWTANCAPKSEDPATCGSFFISGTNEAINQDTWSGSQGEQDMVANAFGNWTVTATDQDASNSPGAVLTYPDSSYNYYSNPSTDPTLSQITSLTSDYSVTMPDVSKNYLAEAAYDVWLNNWKIEVMVWVDNHRGASVFTDSGMKSVGTYTLGGQSYTLWQSPGNSASYSFYIFNLNTPGPTDTASGSVDLGAILGQLETNGSVSPSATLWQIPFGYEICDTAGVPLPFTVNNFDVNMTVGNNPTPSPTPTTPTPTPTSPSPTPTTPTPTPTPTVTPTPTPTPVPATPPFSFAGPANLKTSSVSKDGYAISWNAVTGPNGQKPSSYTIKVFNAANQVVDEWNPKSTSTLNYGNGGHGLPAGTYRSYVWANGDTLPSGYSETTVTLTG